MPKSYVKSIEKPKWFELGRYQALDFLPLNGWFYEFLIRHLILEDLDNNGNGHGLIKMTRVDCLISPFMMLREIDAQDGDEIWRKKGLNAGSLRLSTCRDMYDAKFIKKIIAACEDSKTSNDENIAFTPYDIYIQELTKSRKNTINITVNLAAPDSILIQDFDALLKAARREFNIQANTRVSDSKIDDWKSFMLLPYLDLYIWAKESGSRISNKTYSDWLFPHLGEDNNIDETEDLPRRVRDSTHTKAMEVETSDFLDNFSSVLDSKGVTSKVLQDHITSFNNFLKEKSKNLPN